MSEISRAVRDAVILIPSLEPDGRLPAYIRELEQSGFGRIVVVDDGSGEAYKPIFDEVSAIPRTAVLTHEVNKGKGVALKTGYQYIQGLDESLTGIITADSDGQHAVKDCIRLAEMLEENKQALYLGSRDFNLPDIPPKSRSGNRITSTVFRALYGQWLPDTQTGLRAIPRAYLELFTQIEGERFEYETNMLLQMKKKGIVFLEQPIQTVYDPEDYSSHYNAVKDSWRIFKIMFKGLFR